MGGPCLLTGGGDGKVITWNLIGDNDDYFFWLPQGQDSDGFPTIEDSTNGYPTPSTIGLTALAPPAITTVVCDPVEKTSVDVDDLFSIIDAAPVPRVNPQALKRAGESDSDDDLG